MAKMNTILSDFSVVTQRAAVGRQLSLGIMDSRAEKRWLISAFGHLNLTLNISQCPLRNNQQPCLLLMAEMNQSRGRHSLLLTMPFFLIPVSQIC